MLRGEDFLGLQRLADGQRRQLERLIVLLLVVADGIVQHHKARNLTVYAGAEKVLSGGDVHGRRCPARRFSSGWP